MPRNRYLSALNKDTLEELLTEHTATELASMFGCEYKSIWRLCKKLGVSNPNRKYNHPNLSPSAELSYLIGVVLGDGSICKYKSQYIISLKAKDKELVEKFAEYLAIINNKNSPYSICRTEYGFFKADGHSKELYYFIKNKEYYDVIEKYPCEFITGFFDADGSISRHEKWNTWYIDFVNTDFSLLAFVQRLLSDLNIESHIYLVDKKGRKIARNNWTKEDKDYHSNSDGYKLRVVSKDQYKFARLIHPTIKRKKERLATLLKTKKEWREEVECLYCGKVFKPKTYNQKFCCIPHRIAYYYQQKN